MKGAKEAELIEIGSYGGFPHLQFTCPHCNEPYRFAAAMDRLVVGVLVDPCSNTKGHHFTEVKREGATRRRL